MTGTALEEQRQFSWQQAAYGAYYQLVAAGREVPDHWTKFVERYHPEFLTAEQRKAREERKKRKAQEVQRAQAEAAQIIALDPIRAAKRKELGLDP